MEIPGWSKRPPGFLIQASLFKQPLFRRVAGGKISETPASPFTLTDEPFELRFDVTVWIYERDRDVLAGSYNIFDSFFEFLITYHDGYVAIQEDLLASRLSTLEKNLGQVIEF
jgi:hypothetical protein